MKKVACLAVSLLLISAPALATDAVGGSGLALAALVGNSSPTLSTDDKRVLAQFLNGETTKVQYPAGATIAVTADAVRCRESHVAISFHDCTLTFGSASVTTSGRRAHELFATLIEIGVPGDGAAGSMYEGITDLSCTIDPNEVKDNGGGGAKCTFTPGP